MSYSSDIRKTIIRKVVDEKQKVSTVSRYFSINRHTIEEWIKIAKGLKILNKRPSDRSMEKTKLVVDFVNANPDMSLKEMERELGFSDTNIAYHLQKANYTLKKSRKHIVKQNLNKDKNTTIN